jgi:hypothetical protein
MGLAYKCDGCERLFEGKSKYAFHENPEGSLTISSHRDWHEDLCSIECAIKILVRYLEKEEKKICHQ